MILTHSSISIKNSRWYYNALVEYDTETCSYEYMHYNTTELSPTIKNITDIELVTQLPPHFTDNNGYDHYILTSRLRSIVDAVAKLEQPNDCQDVYRSKFIALLHVLENENIIELVDSQIQFVVNVGDESTIRLKEILKDVL